MFHVTMGHRCGACGEFGHGQVECRRRASRDQLFMLYGADTLDAEHQCRVPFCPMKHLHRTESHICQTCGATIACSCNSQHTCPCPSCKHMGTVDLSKKYYTGGACVVCFEDVVPMVSFPCGHTNVCLTCVTRL